MKNPSRRLVWALPIVLLACNAAAHASDPSSSRVVLVEEHWELKVSQPDTDRSAPQITMVMSPAPDLDGVHFLFTMNHSTVPEYAAGGLQLQAWDGEELLDSHSTQEGVTLDQTDETITWVQRISLYDGHLKFRILNGSSQSWGAFGGNSLTFCQSTSLTSLNRYRPGVSLTESQVNYAENRVASLVLKKLVWVTEDGVVHEQSAPIPVDTSLDD